MEEVYNRASEVVSRLLREDISLKRAYYESLPENAVPTAADKQVYAIVTKVQERRHILESIVQKYMKDVYSGARNKGMILVALHEVYWNNKRVTYFKQVSRRLKPKLKLYSQQIQAHIANQASAPQEEMKVSLARHYVRLNRLKNNVPIQEVQKAIEDSVGVRVTIDKDIPDLLVLSQGLLDAHTLPIPESHLIVQDKASCLPPWLLKQYVTQSTPDDPTQLTILDGCAAPGNKTLQLMEYFGIRKSQQRVGRVVALERDEKRFEVLQKRLQTHCPSNELLTKVECLHEDFLHYAKTANVYDCDYICLDTSCSGTGNITMGANEPHLKAALGSCVLEIDYAELYRAVDKKLQSKINQLARLQLKLLQCALSYPKVKGVVYSTCSIFPQENEHVVQKALTSNSDFALVRVLPQVGHEGLLVKTLLNWL